MHPEVCPLCEKLLDRAANAAIRHMQAIERMDLADIRGEEDLLPALEMVTREARASRENAVASYKHHVGMHRAQRSGATA